MTVSSTVSKSGPYAGAGTTGPFTVGFRFLDNAHLRVVRTDENGTDADLALDVDYTVAGAGGSTGEVTLTDALAVGQKLTIVRDVPTTQEADYVENDAFPAESHETALDKLTMLVQQLDEESERSIKIGVSDTPLQPLPGPSVRANQLIGFDALGNLSVLPVTSSVGAGDRVPFSFVSGVDFEPGVTTQLTLPRAPGVPGNLQVNFDATGEDFSQWDVVDLTLTFTSPIPVGVGVVWGYIGTTVSMEIPPDGSVADEKVAAGSKLHNRITRTYDVRDFGAQCDGIADDAAAINAAESTIAAAGGGILVFPPATIIAGSMLTKRGNIIWQGAGIGATVIKAKDGATMNALVATLNAYALFGTSSISGEFAFGLRDITLDGNKDGGATCDGLAIYGATFSLDNYEITNCTGHGLRTEFGIPGAIPHGYNAQSNSNNALIHDCNVGGVRWDGPPDPSLNNNNIYRNLNYNFRNGVNGTGCKLVNCHVWGSSFDSRQAITGIQLNTPGNLIVNTVSEGATVHQIHLRSNGNVILGGNIYYFSDALAQVYGITIGDIGAGITSADNVIKMKIDNCGLGAIYFNNNAGSNVIEVTGRFSITGGIGFTGATGPSDIVKMRFFGTGVVNSNITVEPNASVFFPGFGGGDGQVSVGAADSGGAGFRVLRVPN